MFETLVKIPGLNIFDWLKKTTMKHFRYVNPGTESELVLGFQWIRKGSGVIATQRIKREVSGYRCVFYFLASFSGFGGFVR